MPGRQTSRERCRDLDLLTAHWREHRLDPRLVESWTYEPGADGVPRLACSTGLQRTARFLYAQRHSP